MKSIIDWIGRSLVANWQNLWGLSPEMNSQNDEPETLATGKLLIDVSQKMQVGVSENVNIRIAEAASQKFLYGVLNSQEAKIENIRTSRSMAVSLRGEDFRIQSLSDAEQIIEENYTQWQYKVVPLKSGNPKLLVVITIRFENEETRRTLPVVEQAVIVRSNMIYSIKAFVLQYWQWLIASAIIPIVGLLLTKR